MSNIIHLNESGLKNQLGGWSEERWKKPCTSCWMSGRPYGNHKTAQINFKILEQFPGADPKWAVVFENRYYNIDGEDSFCRIGCVF